MKFWCFPALCLFVLAQDSGAQTTFVIRAKQMLDVETGRLLHAPAIVVRNGKFVEIGAASETKIPGDAKLIDLSDSTLLPGLIDAHVHLAWGGSQNQGLAGIEEARKTLLSGFTTVRNLGSTGKADFALKKAIENGEVLGPRMLVSGPALGSKGGVCDQVFAGEAVVSTPEEAIQKVRALIDEGADVIKLCAGGPVVPTNQDENAVELPGEIIRAVVNEAHQQSRKVAAHAQGPLAIRSAVEAGVDSIEHGALINEEEAKRMMDRNVFLVPTLYRLDWILEDTEKRGTEAKRIETLRGNVRNIQEHIQKAIALGVQIAYGTDATVYPHGLNARELGVLVRLGMSPLEAIRSATIRAADLLGMKDQIGSIKPGMRADLIAVKGNPLENVTTLESVHFVMKDGQVCSE